MNAVIKTGGKQYIVKKGDSLKVEKLEGNEGDVITFDDVLLTFDDNAESVNVGTPTLASAKVSATISEQGRSKKVSVVKYKPKSRYRRNVGHRQPFTQVTITDIAT